MPHTDLSARLAEEAERGAPLAAIDVDDVIRRTRARRRPALIGVGGLAIVAIVGLGGLGITGLGAMPASDFTTADDAGGGEVGAAEAQDGAVVELEDAQRGPHGLVPDCGSPLPDPAELLDAGLTLTLDIPARASAREASIAGIARLTNTLETPVSGVISAPPNVVLSRDGVIVSRTAGPTMLEQFTLEPGDVREFTTVLAVVECDPAAGSTATPHEYAAVALLTVTLEGSGTEPVLVVSAAQSVVLDP